MRVLVLNAGSSSLKASVIEPQASATLARASVEWAAGRDGSPDVPATVRGVIDAVRGQGAGASVDAVGHRVVHGGTTFSGAVLVDERVLDELRGLRALAPLHQPLAEATIAAARALLRDLPHVAAFDTAFHRGLPPTAYVYPLPYAWHAEWGIRRYGFHGLSIAWSLERAATLLGRRAGDLGLVVAHLGSGCSVTAVWEGRSVDTSMGMTPLEGLMMGTRPGSVDPGMLVALLRERRLSLDDLAETLEDRSGLLGISGTSADMRQLVRASGADPRAALAVAMFVRRAASGIAASATALPRLDALVFTGGIGEHAGTVRSAIVARLGVLGIASLSDADVREDAVLSAPSARVAVLRVEAREDVVIARQVEALLRAG